MNDRSAPKGAPEKVSVAATDSIVTHRRRVDGCTVYDTARACGSEPAEAGTLQGRLVAVDARARKSTQRPVQRPLPRHWRMAPAEIKADANRMVIAGILTVEHAARIFNLTPRNEVAA